MMQPIALQKGETLLGARESKTLVSDLTLSEEKLLVCCTSTIRNEIRRAKKDGASCAQYSGKFLFGIKGLFRQFDEAYAEMYRQKKMTAVSVRGYLRTLAAAGFLTMSISKIGNEVVAYHVYVTGDRIARLLYSVSIFRVCEENAMRNAVGRANRLLHYEDMLWFKKQGFITYDWGGYATDPALASINAFKAGFGGTLVSRYYAKVTSNMLVPVVYGIYKRTRGITG
jgi:lipid II:glycine glycyltransferase (peptidoglycan interpeptide bridge formation enzyme)